MINFKKINSYFIALCLCFIMFGGSSRIGELKNLFLVTLLICLIFNAILEKKIFINKNFLTLILLVFTCYFLVQVLYSCDRSSTISFLFSWIVFVILAISYKPDNDFWKVLMSCIFYFSLAVAVSIIVAIIDKNFILTFLKPIAPTSEIAINVFKSEITQGIYSGIAFERAYAACQLNLGLAIVMADFFSNKKLSNIKIFGTIIIIIALLCTGKRTLFLIPILCFLIFSFLSKKSNILFKYLKLLPVMILIVILVVVVFPQSQKVFERFSNDNSKVDTMDIRKENYWQYCKEMFLAKPILGYGINSFKHYVSLKRSTDIYNAHNIYFQILAECGILGEIMLVIIFTKMIKYSAYSLKKLNSDNNDITYFIIYLEVLFYIYGLTGNVFYYISQLIFYFLIILYFTNLKGRE